MITQHPRHKLSRLAVAGAFLLTGLAGTAQATLAGSPLDDAGGPDGGGAVAEGPIFLEELGLVSTNDPAEPITGHTRLDGPTLVGSGPEREIVANSVKQQVAGRIDESERSIDLAALSPDAQVASSDGQETAGPLSDADVAAIISASGGNGQQVVFGNSILDETARSTDLAALSPQASDAIAQAPTEARFGQPF